MARERSPWAAPIPLRERARWRLVFMLNRSRWVCWADCVSWAMSTRDEQRKPRTRHRLRDVVGARGCRQEATVLGCYCGKFRPKDGQ